MDGDPELTDEARYPGLADAGWQMLKWLREHPHAPRYTATCGHRLTPERRARVALFEQEARARPPAWTPEAPPGWLPAFVEWVFRDVPFYRRYGAPPAEFGDIPLLERPDLGREPWAFVPDSQPLEGLILYATSGTTGHPVTVLSHPVAGASYLPLLKLALEAHGIQLRAGPGQVGCILVGWQRKAYTYASVTPDQGDAGYAKINLHPADWRDPADRARFLDDCNPEVYTGDPLAFAELMRLPLRSRPRALISTAMALLPGLRRQLEAHFGCPAVDVYSMNECGPVAVSVDDGWRLLQPRLYVEILDDDGQPCPPGLRGEVVLTGGFNPFLPLLRYRTHDLAALDFDGGRPRLAGLEGRPPVVFRGADGRLVNNLDVTNVLQPLALPQFTLHQAADGGLRLRMLEGYVDPATIRALLLGLFGADQRLEVEEVASLDEPGAKVVQYTSEMREETAG